MATIVFFMALGYMGAYFLLRRCMAVNTGEATLGATLFGTTAYFLEHLGAGHLNFVSITLLPFVVWLLLDKSIAKPVRICLIALSIAAIVHSGGFYFAVVFGLAIPLTIASICLVSGSLRTRFGDWLGVALSSLSLSICICVSKITAVLSFMRFFPRLTDDHPHISLFKALLGFALQLFFAPMAILFPALPVDDILRRATGSLWGLWEIDAGLSPVILFIFVVFFCYARKCNSMKTIGRILSTGGRVGAFVIICSLGLLSLEFTLSRGFPYTWIKNLPFFSSLHTCTRNGAIFVLPFIVLAIALLRRVRATDRATTLLNPRLLSLAAVLCYCAYIPAAERFGLIGFSARDINSAWQGIRAASDTYRCDRIVNVGDDKVFQLHASSRFPCMPIFGYNLEAFFPLISLGPVEDTSQRYFNMTNPASLVYPKENGLRLFERIAVNDRKNFNDFVHYRATSWKRPPLQHFLDIFSAIAFFATAFTAIGYGVSVIVNKIRSFMF
jgi:hypothetical protein